MEELESLLEQKDRLIARIAKLEAENKKLKAGIHDVINYFRIYQDFGKWTKGLENIYQALKALESK